MQAYSQKLPIGWLAPSFELSGVDGQRYALSTFAAFPALLVVFGCNHFAEAEKVWLQLQKLHERYSEQLAIVVINPEDPTQVPLDNLEAMKGLVERFEIDFPYLVDGDQQVARAFQAECLPEPYLFKNLGSTQFSLFYHGRITDHDLEKSVTKLLASQDPLALQHPSFGSAITWKVE